MVDKREARDALPAGPQFQVLSVALEGRVVPVPAVQGAHRLLEQAAAALAAVHAYPVGAEVAPATQPDTLVPEARLQPSHAGERA